MLVLTSDHITGATGKTPTVTILKNDGLGFVTPAGAVVEEGNGWYQVQPNAADASLLGPITLHATASACDPTDEEFVVVNYNPTTTAVQATPSTSTITVADLITASLRRMNVLQAGEAPSSDDLADGFLRFNDLVDSLALESLIIYQIVRTTWNLVSGTRDYAVGPSGAVNIARPIYIDHVHYQDTTVSPVLERPLDRLTKDAWAAIPFKTQTNTLPSAVYYEPTYPTGTLSFYMTPTQSGLQGVIYAPTAVPRFGATSDIIALPPGYNRMLRDNLALELWPEFRENVPVDPGLVSSAQTSKSLIKVSNVRMTDLGFDPALTGHGYRSNIYTGIA